MSMAVSTPGASLVGQSLMAAGRTLVHWPLLLALYLPGLLLGVAAAVPVYSAGQALAGLGPWTEKIAEGNAVAVLLELSLVVGLNARAGSQALPQEASAALSRLILAAVILGAGVLVQALAYNLLVGGVLERLAGRSLRSFWRACWHWAGPMLLYAFVGSLMLLLLGGVGLAVILFVPYGDLGGLLLKPLIAVLWLGSLNGLFEYGRADMVTRDDRRPLTALGRAFALLARPGLFLQALAIWVLLAVVGLAYWWLAGWGMGAMPVTMPTFGLVISQALALGGALIKLARLAVALAIAEVAR